MNLFQIQWLGAVSWDVVLALNQALCQAKQLAPQNNPAGYEPARQLWEKSIPRRMTLTEVLDVCHQCHELAPFVFNNGNTFAAIARTLLEELLKTMPPVEAQIIRTTVCHYVVGLVDRKEFLQVLRHFENRMQKMEDSHRMPPPTPPAAPPRASA